MQSAERPNHQPTIKCRSQVNNITEQTIESANKPNNNPAINNHSQAKQQPKPHTNQIASTVTKLKETTNQTTIMQSNIKAKPSSH